jgi:hypothetical protein
MVAGHCGGVAACNRHRLLPSLIGMPLFGAALLPLEPSIESCADRSKELRCYASAGYGNTNYSVAKGSSKSAPGLPQDKPSSKCEVNFDHPETM